MKYRLLALLILLVSFASFHSFSQDSCYTILSKGWHAVHKFGSSNSSSFNMIEGENGNFYVASSVYISNGRTAAITKLDKRGQLVWQHMVSPLKRRYSAQATTLCLDNNGDVLILGVIYNSSVFGSTNPDTQDTILCNEKERSYLAKYSPAGDLLQLKTYDFDGDQHAFGSMRINRKNQIFFSGYRARRIEIEKNSFNTDASIWFGKLDADGTLLWQKEYNSPGSDGAVDLVLDKKGNCYLAAKYEQAILVESDSLVNTRSFLAKYSTNGKHIWTRTPTVGSCEITKLCMDDDDQLFVAGALWGEFTFDDKVGRISSNHRPNLFLASVSKRGKFEWLRKVTNNNCTQTGIGNTQLVATNDDCLLLAGSALEMLMPQADSTTQGFKMIYGEDSKHYDAYLIKYGKDGHPRWLRSISGKSAQSISSLVVKPNADLVLGGRYTTELYFKNEHITTKGNVFIAGIKAASLLDTGPDTAMQALEREIIRRASINMDDCSCEMYQKPTGRRGMSNRPSFLVGEDAWTDIKAMWKGSPLDSIPFRIYKYNPRNSRHSARGSASFSIVAFKKLECQLDDNAVTIDFTPCELKEEKYWSVKGSSSWSHTILNHIYDFNSKEFKGTAREYFDIALEVNQLSAAEIFIGLCEESWTYEDEMEDYFRDIRPFLNYFNSKYKLSIKPGFEAEAYQEQLDALDESIEVENEIYEFFYKAKEGVDGMLTRDLESDFYGLIKSCDRSLYGIKEIRKMLYPKYQVDAEFKRLKMKFNSSLINSESPWAMFRVDQVEWNHDKGLQVDYREMDQFCMQDFYIANSGIQVKIKYALPDLSTEVNDFENAEYSSHIFDRSESIPPRFTGLYANECEFTIPIGDEHVTLQGLACLIENNSITGMIALENNSFQILDENQILLLEEMLERKGFSSVERITRREKSYLRFLYQL